MTKGSEKVIRYRKRIKEKMIDCMGKKCQICSYDKCSDALEFHHIDPTKKEYSFGKLRANPRSKEILACELEKCILLCSNCHREIHTGTTKLPENYSTLDKEKFLNG